MRMSARGKLFAIPALAALVLGAAATSQANAAAGRLDPVAPIVCEGKAQLDAVVLTQTGSTTTGETAGAWVPLTFGSVDVDGPAAAVDTDQLVVTFTGEAALNGQPNVLNPVVDAMQVRILVDGQTVPPGGVVFNSDGGQANAVEVCTTVAGPGPHTVSVEWRLFDFNNNNALTGTLNSWVLHVERND